MMLITTINRIQRAWSIDTTWTPELWTPDNPARGQCASTTALLFSLYADLEPTMWAGTATEPGRPPVAHYWLSLQRWEIDITACQFAPGTTISGRKKTTMDAVVSNEWFRERVRNLWSCYLDAA